MTTSTKKRKRPVEPEATTENHQAEPINESVKQEETEAKNNVTLPADIASTIPPLLDKAHVKIVTWNVNSLTASIKKRALDYLKAEQADIVCLQETKLSDPPTSGAVHDALQELDGYEYQVWNCGTRKKGYAGTCILSRIPFKKAYLGFEYLHSTATSPTTNEQLVEDDDEGRVITLEFEEYFLVAAYVPNAGMKLERLDWKCKQWMPQFQTLIHALSTAAAGGKKKVIVCGDINVAHAEVDLARPAQNRNKTPGFTDLERASFDSLCSTLFQDVWRVMHGDGVQRFTYFSYRFQCRVKLLGWRLDYFLCPPSMIEDEGGVVVACEIRQDIWGPSDHVPVVLTLADRQGFQSSISN